MKHKMWSRLLSMVLAVMMITSIVPNSAFAEAASEIAASSQATSEVQVEEVPLPEDTTTEEPAAETPAEEPAAETPAEEPAGEPAPTAEPVAEPTAEPATESEQPTAEPTQAPAETAVPSEQPSAEPTAAPEGTETPEGTAVPTETPAPSASPLPSETPVPSETPAPTETPEATEEPVAMNEEAYEATAQVENADITVTVKVPEGALPVDAELKADLIGEETEEYAEAEAALADEALNEQPVEYDGMIALDIRFELNGEEVEPRFPVEVTIDAKAMLPEDADPETVAVQHLEENEAGEVTAVKTVADATEETGDVTVEAAQAEEPAMDMTSTFAVDGFSTFAVTYARDHYVYIYHVDQDGKNIRDKEQRSVDYYWSEIEPVTGQEDYELIGYYSGINFDSSKKMAEPEDTVSVSYRWDEFRYRVNSGFAKELSYTNIYLVYEKVETTPTPDPDPIDPGDKTTVTAGKTVVLQDGQEPGGTYDLTLSVSGNRGSEQQNAKVDVLFIFDRSGSMKYKVNEDEYADWYETQRIDEVRNAAKALLNTLEKNTELDKEYSLVSFAGPGDWDTRGKKSDANVNEGWTSNAQTVKNKLDNLKADKGTNYQAAFQVGNDQLNLSRRDAQKIVIFLTDGVPSVRNGEKSCENDDTDEIRKNNSAAVAELAGTNANAFYCIGLGAQFKENGVATENLNKIKATMLAKGAESEVYTATETGDLQEVFEKIAGSIQFFQCMDVTITDTMSENAVLAANVDGSQTFTVRVVKDENTVAEKTVTLLEGQTEQTFRLGGIQGNFTLTCESGTIKLEFPKGYLLEEDYTYSITTAIKPSEKAQGKGENYPNTPHKGTGTHADRNEKGYFSNDNEASSVSFTPVTIDGDTVTPGTPGQKNFPMPVIQVKDTSNEYPVRFYLEGIEVGAAKDYPYTDAWATLNSWLSGGFANVTTAEKPIIGFPGLDKEQGYDPNVTGGSVAGGIKGDDNVVKWLEKNGVQPDINTGNIKAVLEKLVDMYPGIQDVPVAAAGGETYTVDYIIKNPSDFKIVYTQVTQNHDQIIEHFRGNGSVAAGQDSYHVHLTIKKNPGDLTITKSFSGVKQLPDEFAIQVSNSVNEVVGSLTLDDAVPSGEGKYTWTIENLDEDTYTVTELNAGVSGKDLSANITVTDEDINTPVTVKGENAKVKVANAKTSTVAITNTYTDSDGYLTINKNVAGEPYDDGRDVFVFKVTAQTGRDAGKVWYFSTNKAGPVVELLKLPVGEYKVEEMSNINYEDPTFVGVNAAGVVEITSANTQTKPAVVTCTNIPKKDPGITDGSGVINKYSNGTITFEPVIIAGDVTGPNGGALPGNKEEEE